jgi:hypothetical protein
MAKTYKSRWGEHDVRKGHVVADDSLAERIRDAQRYGGHDGKGLTLGAIACQAGLTYSSFCNVLSRIESRGATTVKEITWIKIDLALKTLGF